MSMTINTENCKRRKFQWKFNKALFRRPMNRIPIWMLVKEQEKNWRGTLLAVFTIGIISGLIILAALFVSYRERSIHYERLSIEELLWVSEQNRDPLFFWHQNSFVFANRNGSWSRLDLDCSASVRTVADALRITQPMNLILADLPHVSGLWPNAKENAWLVQYGETNIDLQDSGFYYVVVLLDNKRIYVNPEGSTSQPALVHFATWNAQEFSLTVQVEKHLYSTENVLETTNGRGFKCLTCHLASGWIYGYPGWTYRRYFKYGKSGAFWWAPGFTSDRLLVLATDQSRMERIDVTVYSDPTQPLIGSPKSIIYQPFQSRRTDGSSVPKVNILLFDFKSSSMFNVSWDLLLQTVHPFVPDDAGQNSGIYVTRVQWFNDTGFLVRGVTEFQNCGFILHCAIETNPLRVQCRHVWYYCAAHGWLDMRKRPDELDLVPTEQKGFLTVLPFAADRALTYQLAHVQLFPGQRNRVRWLTEHSFHVQEMLHADNETILFSGTAQAVSQHLFRYNRINAAVFCLTCNEINTSLFEGSLSHLYAQIYSAAAVEINRNTIGRTLTNDSARTMSQVRVSANGLYFTAQWYTGYEPFGASATKEAPTRQLINYLTGSVTNASEYEATEFVEALRMDPDAGLSLWYIEPGGWLNTSTIQVYLIWHSHLIMVHSWTENKHVESQVDSTKLIRTARSADTQTTKSVKQHQAPTSTYRMKVKEKFLNATQSPLYLLHPSPPFGDRPVSNVVLRLISFSPTRKADDPQADGRLSTTTPTISHTHIDWDAVSSGALVRLWFPPYLNERHLKSYPLLINVKSTLEQSVSPADQLLDELILYLSGSLDVIVLQVLNWVGDAEVGARKDGISGEIANYHSLLRSLNENYHYIKRNRTALVGSPGLPSHLAGLILGSDKAPLNPTCGVLLAPIARWDMHEFVEAVRLFGSHDEQNYYAFDLTKLAKRYRNKELLIVHGSTDASIPFAQTVKLLSALIEENVDVNFYLNHWSTSNESRDNNNHNTDAIPTRVFSRQELLWFCLSVIQFWRLLHVLFAMTRLALAWCKTCRKRHFSVNRMSCLHAYGPLLLFSRHCSSRYSVNKLIILVDNSLRSQTLIYY